MYTQEEHKQMALCTAFLVFQNIHIIKLYFSLCFTQDISCVFDDTDKTSRYNDESEL